MAGLFKISSDTESALVSVSGNAKQRRLMVRRWRRMGFAVQAMMFTATGRLRIAEPVLYQPLPKEKDHERS